MTSQNNSTTTTAATTEKACEGDVKHSDSS